MTTSAFATDTVEPFAIDSAQLTANGAPRFRIPAEPDNEAWVIAAACEAAGGVSAEGRVFLDEQLGTGDLVLDLNPGFGFLALSAATAPLGVPTVLIREPDGERLMALQDAAADAGAWLETLGASLGLFLAEKAILARDQLAPIDADLREAAQRAPTGEAASFAFLTLCQRARKLGFETPAAASLARSPLVAQARKAIEG